MSKTLLKAKFRGADGSMGFKKGLNYNISFEQDSPAYTNPHVVFIETTTKPLLRCEYGSIYAFFKNWTDIKPR